jgi:ribonuclease HI
MKELLLYTTARTSGDPGPGCMGIVVCSPQGEILLEEGTPIKGAHCTHAQAVYAALIQGLYKCRYDFEAREIECFSDNQALVDQMNGACDIEDGRLRAIARLAARTCSGFEKLSLLHLDGDHPMMELARRLAAKCLEKCVR